MWNAFSFLLNGVLAIAFGKEAMRAFGKVFR